jgi:hypothetical protein
LCIIAFITDRKAPATNPGALRDGDVIDVAAAERVEFVAR